MYFWQNSDKTNEGALEARKEFIDYLEESKKEDRKIFEAYLKDSVPVFIAREVAYIQSENQATQNYENKLKKIYKGGELAIEYRFTLDKFHKKSLAGWFEKPR